MINFMFVIHLSVFCTSRLSPLRHVHILPSRSSTSSPTSLSPSLLSLSLACTCHVVVNLFISFFAVGLPPLCWFDLLTDPVCPGSCCHCIFVSPSLSPSFVHTNQSRPLASTGQKNVVIITIHPLTPFYSSETHR